MMKVQASKVARKIVRMLPRQCWDEVTHSLCHYGYSWHKPYSWNQVQRLNQKSSIAKYLNK